MKAYPVKARVRRERAPCGYELSHEVDDKGRRVLVPLVSEQEVSRRIGARFVTDRGRSAPGISHRLIEATSRD